MTKQEISFKKRSGTAVPGESKGGWDRLIQTLDRGQFDVYNFLKKLRKRGCTGPVGLQCYNIKGDVRQNLERSMGAWQDFATRMTAEDER